MPLRVLVIFIVFLLLPMSAYAGAVIGQDETFVLEPIVFLTNGTHGADIFNYFFTLEVFAGMVGLFIRLCLRVLRL